MNGRLKRLKKAEGMRNDTVDGEFWSWPKVGESFRFFKFTDGRMRIIETSHVTKIITRHAAEVVFEAKDGLFHVIMTAK